MFLPLLFWLAADGAEVSARAAPAKPAEPAASTANAPLAGTTRPAPPSLELLEFIGRGLDRLPSLAPPAPDARTAEAGGQDSPPPGQHGLARGRTAGGSTTGNNTLGNTSPSGAAPCVPSSCVH